jgi:pullulanase-type alpha-1,6-glucosidase
VESLPLHEDPASGTWSITGEPGWKNLYYRYVVEVYAPASGRIERNAVTDPYSLSLATNSRLSQLVDLDDPALKPVGWDELEKPHVAAPEDIVIYELHVRDFSAADPSVPPQYRGTYGAFTFEDSDGMRHLTSLAAAGVTHLHLLPTFDIASIEEDRSRWQQPDAADLAALPPDSARQQAAVSETADEDGFNWGYDPWHYTVPDGSYAVEPQGAARILEYRAMIKALNEAGLNVVMDVVYNHTAASGQAEKSVLDRIVPGYYHRLSPAGAVEQSTCCENTAAEHAMMEKLMLDSLVTWARDYRVDGFRFDLMGHHPKATMLKVRAALDALTMEADGVDGKAIYLYGEGWNFGEVADGARFEQAIQATLAGTGIGTFNDRLRDGARGGTPFSDPRMQGFINGLHYDPNGFEQDQDATTLASTTDWIRIGLAGNLAGFTFENAAGDTVAARDVPYAGQPAGYTSDPAENVVYVAAHDNQTLFDSIQFKAPPETPMDERIRIQNLANSLVLLAQGVPFVHAGQEFLRSKSLDHDSYNSGDWFNAIDWRFGTVNWGKGLPVANRNEEHWPLMRPLLANPELEPEPAHSELAVAMFLELLAIRRSSPLFRLRSAKDIGERVSFHNTGPGQVPGLIVMSLSDPAGDIDSAYAQVVVLFNANDEAVEFHTPITGAFFELHPVQAGSADPVVRGAAYEDRAFHVPARTMAVFVRERK